VLFRSKPRVAVVLHMLEHQPFGVRFKEDFEAELATSGMELDVEFVDSHGNPAEQVRHLEVILAKRPDALVLMVLDPESVRPVVRKYREAGVPVIAVDSDLGEPELYRGLLLADNRAFGRKLGEFFAEASEGRAEIVEIRGVPTSSPARLRSQGFREAIAGHPGMRIVETLTADWLYTCAREAMSGWLPRHPEVDCVFAQNDEMARGARDAACELHREEELLITGVDAIKGYGLSMVLQGKLAASLMNPSPGRPAAAQLLAVLAGEPTLERTVLQTSLIRSNERVRAWQAGRAGRGGPR
jgi:ribose transport system substrate-binding protein